ncbi:uncharacterized protein H6S33_011197 [Morchella sextelata]|uniref:uncharacterized protein n=1 Tax=Morchella sextelata TaxID=1174677 RepID=UPI001D045230|nr:uncharacterized protein H6S33_011197 [Morchella sextelata]KAH0610770.1 hypothetical protein H6S33_011197 [Morchella sextelata]
MSNKKKITWTAEKYQRLLAATIAAHPEIKINYNHVAAMFGEGATYDSIETRFRNVKKEAKILQAEIDSGSRPAVAPPTPRKRKLANGGAPSTPRKIGGEGRARKMAAIEKTPVKQESIQEEDSIVAWSGNGDYSD